MLIMIIGTLIILAGTAFGNTYRITNESGFATFVYNVNSGTGYYDTTVYLDSDISFSGYSINPIGKSSSYQFYGVFNGQGHVISNLVISSSSLVYVGLFGYSERVTIRNVVLDSSCSVTSSYNNLYTYTGGLIGRCHSSYGDCLIENCVSMTKVAFNGDISDNLYIGGIAGYLDSPSSGYKCTVRNCVNYGSIVHSGKCGNYDELGGIVGYSEGYSSYYNYVQNCLNYGTITHSGTSKFSILGGIVGNSFSYTKVQNCLSSGKITSSSSGTSYIGGAVGYIGSDDTHINYCYFTRDVDVNNLYGTGSYSPSSTTGSSTSATNVDSVLITNLNIQAINGSWNEWALNSNEKTITFKINGNNGFSILSQAILFPAIKSEGAFRFKGWYKNRGLHRKVRPKIN